MAVGGIAGGATLCDLSALEDLRIHAVERACAITGRGMNTTEWAGRVASMDHRDSCPTDSRT
jgi:hypothetical protein